MNSRPGCGGSTLMSSAPSRRLVIWLAVASAVLLAALLLSPKANRDGMSESVSTAERTIDNGTQGVSTGGESTLPRQNRKLDEGVERDKREASASHDGMHLAAEASKEDGQAARAKVMLFVNTLLENPSLHIAMADTPPLNPVTEAAVIARCRQVAAPAGRLGVIYLLAYRGSGQSALFFIDMLCSEYANKPITSADELCMNMVPELLGLLARHDDHSFSFLEMARHSTFWSSSTLWQVGTDGVYVTPGTREWHLAEQAIAGLAWSDRSEVDAVFDNYFTHPLETLREHVSHGVMDAAYIRWVVDQRGVEEATRLMYGVDFNTQLSGYSNWRHQVNQRWSSWDDEVRSLEKEEAAQRMGANR